MSVRIIQTWLQVLKKLFLYLIALTFIHSWSLCVGEYTKVSVNRSLENMGSVYLSYEFWGFNLGHQAWQQALSAEPSYEPNFIHIMSYTCHSLVCQFSSNMYYVSLYYILKIFKPNLLSLIISKNSVRWLERWLSS